MCPETSTTLHRLSALGKRRIKDQTGKQGKLVPNQGPRMTTLFVLPREWVKPAKNPPYIQHRPRRRRRRERFPDMTPIGINPPDRNPSVAGICRSLIHRRVPAAVCGGFATLQVPHLRRLLFVCFGDALVRRRRFIPG